MFALASIAVVVGVFTWANRRDRILNPERTMAERTQSEGVTASSPQLPRATTGRNPSPAATTGTSDTIRNIDAITGAPDARELIGRRVDLRATVSDVASDMAFWVGPRDDRVLVVVGRNDRMERQGEGGQVVRSGITTVRPGQPLLIVGTVQPMPALRQRSAWGGAQDASLENHQIYIRADRVIPR